MKRAFLAIQPPEPVLDAVARRLQAVALGKARATPRHQWHLTVQFLGDRVDTGAVLRAFKSVPLSAGRATLRIGGAQVLGRARRAQVLAVGLRDGREWMAELAAQVAAAVGPIGYERDRPLIPHLTVARYRVPTDLRRVRDAIGSEPIGPPWTVEEIVLFESVLSTDGATHEAMAHIPVG